MGRETEGEKWGERQLGGRRSGCSRVGAGVQSGVGWRRDSEGRKG